MPDFALLRVREFGRLDMRNEAYLDYTGSALYAASQIERHHRELLNGVFGNPHSQHDASQLSEAHIEGAREGVLAFFGVSARTHAVVFTASTTAAIKLVAESFPFHARTPLILSADNHNSVNGMREYARRAGAPVITLPLDGQLRLSEAAERITEAAASSGAGLLAFPAQSNFSGVQHDLALVGHARRLGLTVLLDAAAFVPTNPLDLSRVPADFAALSFYKLFGYPTGVGALVARHEALARLHRPSFSGGTVNFVSIQNDRYQLRDGVAGFEDGTPNFVGIPAVSDGLDFLRTLGMDAIHQHACVHARAFLDGIGTLTHGSGEPVVETYGPERADDRGATIAFNVRDARGRVVPFPIVEDRARAAGVSMRGGCFCNPGAAEAAFRFDAASTAECLDRVGADFSIERFAACLGDRAAVGAMRASFGIPTNARDIARGVAVIASFRK